MLLGMYFKRLLVLALAPAALCACGRIGFDPLAAELDARSSPMNDATEAGLRLNRLTPDGPIFRASDAPLDDYYYLISTVGSQRPSSFVFDSKIYFSIPSKSNDSGAGGWHYSMAHWTPGQDEALWVDGNPSEVGDQALLLRNTTDANGFLMRNHITTHFVQTPDGYLGLSNKYFSNSEYTDITSSGFFWIGVGGGTPETLNALDFLVDTKAVINIDDNDGTWRGSTTRHADLHYKDGEVLIYQTQLNSPADDKHSIAISRTPDMKTFQLPSESILDGYSRAQVFEYQGAFYMVAFSDAALRWQLLRGDSFDSFDASAAQTIELGSVLHGTGAWDDTPLLTDLPGGEPRIAGVDVIDDKVYLFYLAGSFGQLETDTNSGGVYHGTPYDGPRGIGVFELTIPN